jgi:beta-glucosidase
MITVSAFNYVMRGPHRALQQGESAMRKLLGPNPRRVSLLAIAVLAAAPTLAQQRAERPAYRNPTTPIEQRVEDLLARMTQDEKIAQITTIWTQKKQLFDSAGRFDPAAARRLYPSGIGQFARPSDLEGPGSPFKTAYRDVRQTIELVNGIQRYASSTRLGIPVLFHEEGLHGYAARGATHFPQAIALASSWDPALLEQVFTVVAREFRARGVHQVLAPVVDVGRDPRWGRIEETYGEDPYLVGELGVAAVRGFQGPNLPLAPDRVLATLKHMTGHGQPESGNNVAPANISERILREVFFPPFRAAVERGNAQAVMPSYNEIDGVPSHMNRWLLHDVLRGEMGFKGAVVSDYFAIEQLVEVHHTTADPVNAAGRALKAGVDFDLPDGASYALLPRALAQGLVTQGEIDEAVRRMLRLKFIAGLFEQPYADVKRAQVITDNAGARALALEAARKSVVLLKNDSVLPLRMDRLRTLAVIGPNAARIDLGGYSNVPTHAVSVLDGIKAKVRDRVRIVSAEGVRLTDSGDWYQDEVVLSDPQRNRELIQEAVQVAQGADAIVLVIGGSSATSREAWAGNHLGDRADLGLIGEQNELASAMFALRKPVVVVLINGQPLSIPEVAAQANALIEGWYLGQEGGTAMADILFGDANPGGKLPVTIARSIGQLPMFYNHKPSAHRGYHFGSAEPLFPFGYGLSYTTFEIGAPRLSATRIGTADSVTVSVDVRNTGTVAGDEVVQLYVRDVVSSITRPVKELKAFRRITLAPGASTVVEFTLGKDAFAFWNDAMRYAVEPGEFQIMTGPNSVDLKTAVLTVAQAGE